jgi:phenylpropionate dioxygenase-like ring-hydroxylating dioxygenase large terminal subunit
LVELTVMLVPDWWYALLESDEVPAGKPLGIRRLGESLVCWRDSEGQLSVMKDRCPHRSSQLSLGRVVEDHIQCPFHGFELDGDGSCRLIPANGRAASVPKVFQCAVYPSREVHGLVWVWHGRSRSQYPPVSWFLDLDGFQHATMRKEWDIDWTRAVEGLLDVSHLPFVHARTIGRDRKTLVNGPYTTLVDDTIRIWVSNQPDEGLPAIKPTQLPAPEGEAMLEFRFPNVWQLRISDQYRIVNVIAPVEEGRIVGT